jgi:hypothetical protein
VIKLLLLGMCFVPSVSHALIWVCTDANGERRFTNIKAEATTPNCALLEWIPIEESKGVTLEYNHHSIASTGRNIKVWVRWKYASPQQMKDRPFKQYSTSMQLMHINCQERTSATVQTVWYGLVNGKSVPVHHTIEDAKFSRLSDVMPGTHGERIVTTVCKSAR